METVWKILATLGLVALNGFFVAAEFAAVGARASRIEADADRSVLAQLSRHIKERLDLYLSSCQLGVTLASLGLGAVIDRSPKRSTAAICFLSQACGLGLLLALPDSVAVIYCGIVLFGLSVGNVITLPPLVVHAEFDAASFGLIVGLSGAFAQFALAFAPGAFGLLHDISGSYGSVLLACIALQMAAAGLVLCCRQRW